jgi:hypothetical protein
MPKRDKPESTNWWTTLPGVITALATFLGAVTALIVALNNGGLLNRVSPLDASHSMKSPVPESPSPAPKPASTTSPDSVEPTSPMPSRKPEEQQKSQELEYDSYYNAKYGFSVIYPKTLLFPEKEESYGRRFKSLDGKVTLNLNFAGNTEHQKPPEAYAEMVQLYSKNTPLTISATRAERLRDQYQKWNASGAHEDGIERPLLSLLQHGVRRVGTGCL